MDSRLGLSPLIATVLLIVFVISAAALTGPFFSEMELDVQDDTSQDAERVMAATGLGLRIQGVSYNRSTSNLSVSVQNTGDRPVSGLSVGVLGGKPQQIVSNQTLGQNEITTVQIPAQETFLLQEVRASLTEYPVSTEEEIKCTPTQGLVGYWSFNNEQTKNGYAIDVSGHGNNGSIGNLIMTSEAGRIGESYRFNKSDSIVKVSDDESLQAEDGETFTTAAWVYPPKEYSFGPYYHTVVAKTNNFRNSSGLMVNYEPQPNQFITPSVNGFGTSISRWSISDYGKWYHLVSLVSNTKSELFVNGESKASKSYSGSFDQDPYLQIGGSVSGDRMFVGKIDEVRIYNRSLSEEEIRRLYEVREESWAVNACKLVD